MRAASSIALVLALPWFVGCEGDDDTADDTDDTDVIDDTDDTDTDEGECDAPVAWSAPDWDANTVEALAVRQQLADLVGLMSEVEDLLVTIDHVDDLTPLYEAGDPSLEAITTPGFAPVVDDAFAEFVELALVGPLDIVSDDYAFTPGPNGGISLADGRGINEGGLEIRQIVDKGLFAGGAFYPYALDLTAGTIDGATIESIAAIWGADATLTENDDLDDSANYSAAMGFFQEIAEALTAAHTYAEDPACVAERDAALVTAFRAWELSMMARFVYYANAAEQTLAAPTSPDDVEGALHELAEGVGLAMGFVGMAEVSAGPLAGAARTITDAEIEDLLSPIGVDMGDLGASTTGFFSDDPTGFAAGVRAAEQVIMDVYGLTEGDIAAFREPAPE